MSFRESYLQARIREQKLKLVEMNHTEINYFSENASMGTQYLCGCSVVVIASPQCAILAHIAPIRPGTPANVVMYNEYFEEVYVREAMETVKRFYQGNQSYFQRATARVICPKYYGGQMLLGVEANRDIMLYYLQQIGLSPSVHYYTITGNLDGVGQRTVVVDGPEKPTDGPVIYLEDIQI